MVETTAAQTQINPIEESLIKDVPIVGKPKVYKSLLDGLRNISFSDEDPTRSYYSNNESDKQRIEKISKSLMSVDKSFTAGYGIDPEKQQGGAALKVESLDTQIKQWTYGTQELTLYADLIQQGTVEANSTVEQYVVFDKHGHVGHVRFQPEIGMTDINSPMLRKAKVNMKYVTDVKQTSFAIQKAQTIQDADALLMEDAITVIAKTLEWCILFGDADLSSLGQGEGLEFDGLEKLIDKGNHIDARGNTLTQEYLNRAAVTIGERGFGEATDAYMSVAVKGDFTNQYLGAFRYVMGSNTGTSAGVNVDRFQSANGYIKLHGSLVMDIDRVLDEDDMPMSSVTGQIPESPSVTATVVPDAGGQFLQALDLNGNVTTETDKQKLSQLPEVGEEQSYKVVAVDAKGDSLPSEEATATPTKSTDGIKLSITVAPVQKRIPDYIAIYRKATDGKYYLIKRIPMSSMNGSNVLEFTDLDETIPGTSDVFVGELKPSSIALMEFIPMCEIPLATVSTATQYAIYWSGALALYRPKCWVQIHNVRTLQTARKDENHLLGLNTLGYKAN